MFRLTRTSRDVRVLRLGGGGLVGSKATARRARTVSSDEQKIEEDGKIGVVCFSSTEGGDGVVNSGDEGGWTMGAGRRRWGCGSGIEVVYRLLGSPRLEVSRQWSVAKWLVGGGRSWSGVLSQHGLARQLHPQVLRMALWCICGRSDALLLPNPLMALTPPRQSLRNSTHLRASPSNSTPIYTIATLTDESILLFRNHLICTRCKRLRVMGTAEKRRHLRWLQPVSTGLNNRYCIKDCSGACHSRTLKVPELATLQDL